MTVGHRWAIPAGVGMMCFPTSSVPRTAPVVMAKSTGRAVNGKSPASVLNGICSMIFSAPPKKWEYHQPMTLTLETTKGPAILRSTRMAAVAGVPRGLFLNRLSIAPICGF